MRMGDGRRNRPAFCPRSFWRLRLIRLPVDEDARYVRFVYKLLRVLKWIEKVLERVNEPVVTVPFAPRT